MGPLILRVDFTVLRRRVQAAFGLSVHAVTPVEGVPVLEGLPQLRTYRLWHQWQRAVVRRGQAQEVNS